MILHETTFFEAINKNDFQMAESILLDSDSKSSYIHNYIDSYGKEKLQNALPEFRSKGLVRVIELIVD